MLEEKGPEINILGNSLEYFDRYGIFDSLDFERDILKKTISKVIQDLGGKTDKSVILGLPANILKARIIHQSLKRTNPEKIIDEKEEKNIYQKISEEAKKEISQVYSQEFGILPGDIQFVNLKILEIKIDGYQVLSLQKYQGKTLDFRILTTFLPSYYLKKIKNIIESTGLKVEKIIQEVEGLNLYFDEKPDGIFLDIGGLITQICLVRSGILEKIDELQMGGQIFSKAISERLGLSEQDSRILKERYSKRELSKETSERLKEILWFPSQIWFENLKSKLEEMTGGNLLPSNIIVFGGGSQLPDIVEILKKGDCKGLLFSGTLNVQIFYPKDKAGGVKFLNSPQETPSLLMFYAKKSY